MRFRTAYVIVLSVFPINSLLSAFLVFITLQTVQGQELKEAHLYFEHYTTNNGLPSNEIYYVFQDHRKYIWVCTDNGVSRYDGRSFRNYSQADGLVSGILFGCKEDPNKKLWFYSFSGELVFYDEQNDRFLEPPFNQELKKLVMGEVIMEMAFAKDTIILILATGIIKISSVEDHYQLKLCPAIHEYLDIWETSDGQLYYTGRVDNLKEYKIRYHPNSKDVSTLENPIADHQANTRLAAVKSRENIFITKGNLLIYETENHAFKTQTMPFNASLALCPYQQGVLVGSYGQGIWNIQPDGSGKYKMECLIQAINVSSINIDHCGGIWASSHEYGLFYFPSPYLFSFQLNTTFKATKINITSVRDNALYYATYDGEIGMVQIRNGNIVKDVLYKAGLEIRRLIVTDDGLLYNQGGKLKILRKKNNQWISSPLGKAESQLKIPFELTTRSRKNNVGYLAISNFGSASDIKVVADNWNYGRVRRSAMTDHAIYCGNVVNLFYVDSSSRRHINVGLTNGFNTLDVRSIFPLSGDTVLVATKNDGLLLVCYNKILRHITKEDGLTSNCCLSIASGADNTWLIGTDVGLDQIKGNIFGKFEIVSASYKTGLHVNPVSNVDQLENFIVIGSNTGLYFLDTAALSEPVLNYDVEITQFLLNDKITSLALTPLNFEYDNNTLAFIYRDFNFRNAQKSPIRYRLITPNDSSWNISYIGTTRFNALAPGSYTFEIQAKNSYGQWITQKSQKIGFTIKPPYWRTWWFASLLLLTVITLFVFYYRYRVKQLKKMAAIQLQLAESKFKALGSQLNPHFVFNVLNSVSGGLVKMEPRKSMMYLGKLSKLMRQVFRNSQASMIPLQDELDAINQYLNMESVRQDQGFNFEIEVGSNINKEICFVPSLVLQPFVENAIKYGAVPHGTSREISLKIYLESNQMVIRILDNGIGINGSLIKSVHMKEKHSIQLISQRLNLLEEVLKQPISLKIMDRSIYGERGTEVKLRLPVLYKDHVKSILIHESNNR